MRDIAHRLQVALDKVLRAQGHLEEMQARFDLAQDNLKQLERDLKTAGERLPKFRLAAAKVVLESGKKYVVFKGLTYSISQEGDATDPVLLDTESDTLFLIE